MQQQHGRGSDKDYLPLLCCCSGQARRPAVSHSHIQEPSQSCTRHHLLNTAECSFFGWLAWPIVNLTVVRRSPAPPSVTHPWARFAHAAVSQSQG